MDFVIITGLSGAGKSMALNAMEDIGYYCVDNIPDVLLPNFYELCEKSSDSRMKKVAVVIDVRSGNVFDRLIAQLNDFRKVGKDYKLLFLDAKADTLLKRYKETRRRHPVMDLYKNITTQDAVTFEKQLLTPVKHIADYLIDTTEMSVKQLKERITNSFVDDINGGMLITCMSFGFKYGIPTDSDLVFDVRCLPNPFYISELKPLTGLDESVRNYVLNNDETQGYIENLFRLLDYSIPLYITEGKSSLVIAVGCTGGKHRSVTLASVLDEHFAKNGQKSAVHHRDISKV